MVNLNVLRVWDKFTLDTVEYRKIRPQGVRGQGRVNVQNTVTGVKSYLFEHIKVTPVTDAWTKRRSPIQTRNAKGTFQNR